MHKFPLITAALLSLMFILSGCPLELSKSIDNGSYPVPSFLNGKWWEVTKGGTRKTLYDIRSDKTNKNKFKAYVLDSTGKPGTKIYDVIMSSVSGKVYLNVYEPGDDETPRGYYLLDFRKVSDKEFVLTGLKENTLGSESSREEILNYLTKNKDMADILDPTDQYIYKKD